MNLTSGLKHRQTLPLMLPHEYIHMYNELLIFLKWTEEEERALKDPIIKKYEHEGHPYYSSARYDFIPITHLFGSRL